MEHQARSSTAGAGDGGPPRWRRPLVLALLLLAAYAVPRGVAYRGITHLQAQGFGDAFEHYENLHRHLQRGPRSLPLTPHVRAHPSLIRHNAAGWPRGVYEIAAPLAALFGVTSIWTVQLTHLLFTVVLVWGVLGLGAALGGPRVGVWAALLTLLCPPLVASTCYLSIDYPLTAMVVMGLYLLHRSQGFSRLAGSLQLGLWSGLGLLVKTPYPLFLLVPALVELARSLYRGPARLRVLLRAAAAAAVAAGVYLLLTDVWIGVLLGTVIDHYDARPGMPAAILPPWTAAWALAYLRFALVTYPGPLLLLALPGLVALCRKGAGPARWLVLGALGGGYVLLTLIDNKIPRYVYPLYPLLCLVTAWWAAERLPRRWRTGALVALGAAYAVTLGAMYAGLEPWPGVRQRPDGGPLQNDMPLPTADDLGALRQAARAQAGAAPLRAPLRALAALVPGQGVLGVTVPGEPQDFHPREQGFWNLSAAVSAVANEARPRLLLLVHTRGGHFPYLDSYVVVHDPGQEADTIDRASRRVARREVTVRWHGSALRLVLSLYRRGQVDPAVGPSGG